jgi:hypothetical protein
VADISCPRSSMINDDVPYKSSKICVVTIDYH